MGKSLLVSGGVHSNTTSPHNTGHLKVERLQSTHLLEHLHDKIYVLCRVWHGKARLKLKCCGPTLQDTNHDPTQPQPKSEPFTADWINLDDTHLVACCFFSNF